MNTTTLPELGHRKLAAIVFTDMVSFSAMVGRNEEKTLQRLQHHFTRMREFAAHWRGEVIKSTGDGLMIYFESATDAVSWALDVQNRINAGNPTLPANERIQHRIGIHLGDVFFKDGDVMGDGVNIAARLQAEADPGGICISQTVYDVVRMRMNVQATFLGERELKNIQEAIPVYQILLNAQQQVVQASDDTHISKIGKNFENESPSKTKLIIGILILFCIVDSTLFFIWLNYKNKKMTASQFEPIPTVMPLPIPSSLRKDKNKIQPLSIREEVNAYLTQRLRPFTIERPLRIDVQRPAMGGGRPSHEFDIWMENDQLVVKRPNGEIFKTPINEIKPPLQGRIVMQMVKNNPNDPASIQMREKIRLWMEQHPQKNLRR